MAEKIKTGLEADGRKAVAQALSRLLADSYAVYLKTHGFHWNVRGPNFSSLHALFMEQYTEMWQAIDDVAERIRALGELAPQGYGAFGNLSAIKDGDPEADSEAMLKALTGGNETVIATAREALSLAQSHDDEASAGIIADRLEAHEKHAWMLRATLGGK